MCGQLWAHLAAVTWNCRKDPQTYAIYFKAPKLGAMQQLVFHGSCFATGVTASLSSSCSLGWQNLWMTSPMSRAGT
jgi:hypothetical protein